MPILPRFPLSNSPDVPLVTIIAFMIVLFIGMIETRKVAANAKPAWACVRVMVYTVGCVLVAEEITLVPAAGCLLGVALALVWGVAGDLLSRDLRVGVV